MLYLTRISKSTFNPHEAHGAIPTAAMSLLQEVSTPSAASAAATRIRIAYFVTHPIQYQAPLLRRIALESDIELTAFFFSDLSVRGYVDKGFGGVHVKWDVPLLDGYNYKFLPSFRNNGTLGTFNPISHGIISCLRHGGFDAVWVHGYHTLNHLHVIFAAHMLGIPTILRAESMLYDRERTGSTLLAKRMFFPVLKRAIRCVMPIGKANAEYWKQYLGQDIPNFPMPYAVDNDFFRNRAIQAAPQREVLRKELGLEVGRPVFLFASKLQDRKRCIDLVEAYIRLSPAPGVDPQAYLLIVGDGHERQALERRIHDSGLSSIHMLGFRNQSELPRYFDLCDAFILPSIHEPWGLIVNEVMNAGRPVIVTDQVGCQPDLIVDGLNGFVFPAQDIEALTSILRRILDDPGLAQIAGQRALESISLQSFEEDVQGLRQALAYCVSGFSA
jgi:glycosyltransferase involved in cell wall biosynthesis